MSFETKAKLIELIKKNDCIYNPKNKRYKNHVYKTILWERIGADLGMEGMRAKDIWRCLRDGYIRYKKHSTAQKSGSGRKYCNYTWSKHLQFLDGLFETKRRKKNARQLKRGTLNTTVVSEASPESQQLSPSSIESEHSVEWVQTGPSWGETETSPQSQISQHQSAMPNDPTLSIELPPWFSSSNWTEVPQGAQHYNSNQGATDATNIKSNIDKPKTLDATDHLFMSYVKTFRQLSFKKQTELKITLAKLFADAEYSELNSSPGVNFTGTDGTSVVKGEDVSQDQTLLSDGVDVKCLQL